MKTTNILILLSLIILYTACSNPTKENHPTPHLETTNIENQSPYIIKGNIISDGETHSYHFLDAKSLMMQADEANAFIDSLRTAYKQDSTDINTAFALGTYYSTAVAFSGGSHCDSALLLLSKVIENKPAYKSAAAYFNRAQAYFCKEDWQAAAADLEKYIQLDSNPSVYTLLGLAKAAYEQGDSSKACEYFKTYKAATPNHGSSAENIWQKRCK